MLICIMRKDMMMRYVDQVIEGLEQAALLIWRSPDLPFGSSENYERQQISCVFMQQRIVPLEINMLGMRASSLS